MIFKSQNCIIASHDTDLIGKLVMNGHIVHYDEGLANLAIAHEKIQPDLVILDMGVAIDQDIIDVLKEFTGIIIIRGVLTPSTVIPPLDEQKIIVMPPNLSNDTIIDRITHLHDTPIWPTGKEQKSILIIEDNTDIVEMYTLAFQSRGYKVASALNGLIGITKAVSERPDVIILDIMMPEMDWFEVLQTLKNNTNVHTKIVVNSNLEWVDEESRVKTLWADYFLRKSQYTPLDVVEFIEKQIIGTN